MNRGSNWRNTLLICALLAGACFVSFRPVLHNDFLNFDDPDYVTDNTHVLAGLSASSLEWAFTATEAGNWHPLTWISHMADVQLFGLRPGLHHLTSLLLHMANAILVFLLWRRLTGATWRSAILAGLWAIHPLRVESVAWIAERKDLLSGLFFLLTLLAWVKAVGTPYPASPKSNIRTLGSASLPGRIWHLFALTLYACGLMSKPMVVTVPCVLLLLDFWPLRRLQLPFSWPQARPVLFEKIPFVLLSIGSSVITVIAQKASESVVTLAMVPFPLRLLNAAWAYLRYVLKTVWPVKLAPFYPFSFRDPVEYAVPAVAVLLLAVGLAWFCARKRPHITVGVLWFLGTLVPVIGLVQVGKQAIADRYTYIPLIGLSLVAVWEIAEWVAHRGLLKVGVVVSTLLCLGLGGITYRQAAFWANPETLFQHAIEVTPDNYLAEGTLGMALVAQGKVAEAKPHFAEAVRINPQYADGLCSYGLILIMEGKEDEGVTCFERALAAKPNHALSHLNLGRAQTRKNQWAEAVSSFREAVRYDPGLIPARLDLAVALEKTGQRDGAFAELQSLHAVAAGNPQVQLAYGTFLSNRGQLQEAEPHLAEAVRLAPQSPETHKTYGLFLAQTSRNTEAIQQFREAVKIQPDLENYYNLALALAVQRETREAVSVYRSALRLSPNSPQVLNDLAWSLATDQDEQVRNGAEALELASRACEVSQNKVPQYLGTLAAAYAEAGRFPEAMATAEKARDLARAAGQEEVAKKNEELLELYRAGKPVREVRK